jgi:hypothetical protein
MYYPRIQGHYCNAFYEKVYISLGFVNLCHNCFYADYFYIIYTYFPLQVLKAEHQYELCYAESQQNEAACEKLKLDMVEKECELLHTKELCSELQRQVQEMKQVHNISVEEDPCIESPG